MNSPVRSAFKLAAALILSLGISLAMGGFPQSSFAFQQDPPQEPLIAEASNEGQEAIAQYKIPKGLEMRLFSAEPDVANPVAIHIDFNGKLFVCESFRQEKGVEDNRSHSYWLDEDLAAQTIEDRVAYMKKHFADNWQQRFESQDDRIRLIEDTDGDGVGDKSSVFSDNYNAISMGTGAGVLSYRGNVYFTCIPDLWLIKDQDNDGVADSRESLHTGFGIRFAFRGHDLHGLIVGPDGRLYFSIGDRGYNLGEGMKDPASGAVFRCELDGSNLEVVATGLRNPQELAFDDYGNLFTGDNNSDSGDMARWVYIVPGSDTGWRMYYQYLEDRGPFNREQIWKPYDPENTPAYIVPPITNLSDGPSGLAYYPGTGFGDRFKGRFFLCDFRGNAANSGVRTFRTENDGAFFKVVDMDQTIWNLLATDIDFGPDGKIYLADWVFGWVGENKGRIYTIADPKAANTEIVKEVQTLLGGELAKKENMELVELLGHADRRVRQEAQFELVARDQYGLLEKTASTDKRQLARIHGLWGFEQLHRKSKKPTPEFVKSWLSDTDPEIRAQAARAVGDQGWTEMADTISNLLGVDENLRVHHFVAQSLSKVGSSKAHLELVTSMLTKNKNRDPIIRHSGIMAIKGMIERGVLGDEAIKGLLQQSPEVQLASVVALRKLKSPLIGDFLASQESNVRLEAARAIYDLPIDAAMPQLASLVDDMSSANDPLIRRIIHANSRIGKPENAIAIAELAANSGLPEERRVEALQALANWQSPPKRDPVLGQWRALPDREPQYARDSIALYFDDYAKESEAIVEAAVSAAGILKLDAAQTAFAKIVLNDERADGTRAAALESLNRIDRDKTSEVIAKLESRFANLPDKTFDRFLQIVSEMDAPKASTMIASTLEMDGKIAMVKKQSAIQTLGSMKDSVTAEQLSVLMNAVSKSDFDPTLRLDIVNAVESRKEDFLQKKLAAYTAALETKNDKTSFYADSLFGGNEAAGKKIFAGKTEVSCIRCHKIDWVGGEVGPDLSKIGTKDRKYLLEAIVDPNKTIAEGYAQRVVQTIDGIMHTGIVKEETDSILRLMDSDGNVISIAQDDIEESRTGMSSMPPDLMKNLTTSELRDLIEYLARRKTEGDDREFKGDGHGE